MRMPYDDIIISAAVNAGSNNFLPAPRPKLKRLFNIIIILTTSFENNS